jgi:hypothetical protein
MECYFLTMIMPNLLCMYDNVDYSQVVLGLNRKQPKSHNFLDLLPWEEEF